MIQLNHVRNAHQHGSGVRSVKELALNTGFSTPSYFTRAYTASFGHPPSADLS